VDSSFARRRGLRWVVIAGLLSSTCAGQPANIASTSTAEVGQIVTQLVNNNEARAAQLQHYEGCREYKIDYAGFPSNKSAAMVVSMEYTAPAEKRFQVLREEGPKLLVSKVLKELLATEKEASGEEHRKATALTPDNYEFRFAGNDTLNGRPQFMLDVMPRTRSKYLYQGRVWVDATDYAVSRIQAQPAKNPSFWISHTEIEHDYMKVGEFWLPARNVSITKVRLGGTATLKIHYENYVIGKQHGLSLSEVCSNIAGQTNTAERR